MKEVRFTRKRYFTFATIGTVLLLILVLFAAFGKQSITLTEEEVRSLVEKQLPVRVKGKKLMVDYIITINELPFKFQENGTIAFIASPDIETDLGGVTTSVEIAGVPEIQGQSFYFKPTKFDVLALTFDSEMTARVSAASALVRNIAKKHGDLLDGTNIKFNSESNKEKILTFLEGEISKIVIRTLQTRPIYTLEGASGFMVSLGVDQIEVTDNNLTIHFSLLQFTGMVLLFLLIAITAIAAAFTAPWWMHGLIAVSPLIS